MMSRARLAVLAFPLLLSAAQEPAFEVATIKPTAPDWRGGRYLRMQSAHQFEGRNHTLKTLLAAAFSLSPKAISGGPAWVDTEKFDILARTPGEARPHWDQQMLMLQSLLKDRFGLVFHRESKDMPVFTLTVVAKTGPKLKESDPQLADASPEGPPALIFVLAPELVRLPARYASMADLAHVFQRAALDRPVLDQTGLKGRYDFDLEFTPDESQFGGAFANRTVSADAQQRPGLFAAMQEQLGLKLTATRGPVETLVIDRATTVSAN